MIAVPVSLIGTFAVFPLLGFSINTLSLFGLVLAIGLVVRRCNVVVEAVEHHIEEGMSPPCCHPPGDDRSLWTSRRHALILASVFVPVAFTAGIQGRLNKQFAVTIANLCSHFGLQNALTLSPALSALLLRPRKESKGLLAKFFGAFQRLFEKATHGYVNLSNGLIRKTVIAVLILGGFGLFDAVLGRSLPTSFLPEEGLRLPLPECPTPPAASLARTDLVLKKVEAILGKTEGVQVLQTRLGDSVY